MTKSHARGVTVKPRSYGGSNFIHDCSATECAFKTYEYLWGAKSVTFKVCARNWAADKSYNALAIYSDRGEEVYEEYDADKNTKHTVSCTIGSVTGDSFLIMPSAGTYLSEANFMWTCYIYHVIYRREQNLTHGYYLKPLDFIVPYTWTLNQTFSASINVEAAYGGTGSPTGQRYHFELVELTDGQKLLDSTFSTMSPGDKKVITLEATFDEDMKLYCLSAWYYDASANEYRMMCGICWRIKKEPSLGNAYTHICVDCVKP